MAHTAKLAAWVGHGKGFEIREYPGPDPAAGAVLIHVALANKAEHLKGALDLMMRTRHTYPYDRILSHTFPLEHITEAFRQQEDGHITRGAIAPN